MKPATINFLAVIISAAFILSGCAIPTGGSVSVDWEEPVSQSESPEPKVAKKNGPPPHAKAHGYRAKHSYRYYPNECTYYDSRRNLYFILEKNGWIIGASLPSNIKLSNEYVSVKLETDKPYEYYEEHSEKYPPQKKNKKGKEKDKNWAKK